MNKIMKLLLIVFLSGIFLNCSDEDRPTREGGNNNSAGSIKVKEGMNLVGMVLDGNTPIEGVVVSDGYTVTKTDEDGIYQMSANRDAKFVFLSVPADCEIPVGANNIPKIYKTIGVIKQGDVLRRDFSLKRTQKIENFTLLALADVQIGNSTDLNLLKVEVPKIKSYIDSKITTPVYGISLGDLVWDNMPYLQQYAEETGLIGVPTFQVIGNHDHNKAVLSDDAGSAVDFEANFGPTYYSYNIGDCHFVVLDDVLYTGDKNYTGNITQNQLDWLKKDLEHVSKDKLIILGVHIPTKRRNSSGAVSNNQDLYTILDGYKVRILSGHSHNNYTTTISPDIEENTMGSVMGAFWSGDLCNDGSPRGYTIYEIEGNEIKNRYYKGTSHDRDYQMYLYNIGEAVTVSRQDGLIFNLFNWHTNWTVKVYEDGVYTTTLTNNVKELDRRAYDFMDGPSKPAYRPSAEPERNNDHMFYYKPSASWSTVKVEATDPYGNTYIQSINR
ncbi:calcineurin-like phosphoesterase family protein [Dysgonomonas sp. 25]|uniref:calcineurin-like phosphoesterase C-terminal domain-containing protein n=1 Tax=Dysgonomonas sp. 25 TaxID=2302933 RepID=UPI0016262E1F|nr:calcineurin-like phosphoesterase family protein [Dysgonomonas sp. 25]